MENDLLKMTYSWLSIFYKTDKHKHVFKHKFFYLLSETIRLQFTLGKSKVLILFDHQLTNFSIGKLISKMKPNFQFYLVAKPIF